MQDVSGSLEQEAGEKLQNADVPVDADIPMLGARTCQQVDQHGFDQFKNIYLTYKNKISKRTVVYPEPFIFDVKENPIQKAAEKREKAASDLYDTLGDRFAEFSDADSIFGKLSWINHRTWVTSIAAGQTSQQVKESAKMLTEFGRKEVSDQYNHFKVN